MCVGGEGSLQGDFSGWGNKQIFGLWGHFPISPIRENCLPGGQDSVDIFLQSFSKGRYFCTV